MNRLSPRILVLFFATVALAQEPESSPPNPFHVVRLLERHQASLEVLTHELRRDAYIVSQLVSAIGDLNDFQQAAAVQKAIDRIDAALKRGSEKPIAPKQTLERLDSIRDLLLKAREQGSSAEMADVQKQLIARANVLQKELFRELGEVRHQREELGELQSLILKMTEDVDLAMSEALGTTFDFIRIGGR